MAKELKGLSIIDLLPSSVVDDDKVKAAAMALDNELELVTALTRETLIFSRIDELPENVIDLLAWQWHVDFYDPAILTIEKKRKLIKQSLAWHRIKGTPFAVEQVIGTVLDKTEVTEWFEYGGEPYHFRIKTASLSTDTDTVHQILRMANISKNTRSWLDGLDYLAELGENIEWGEMVDLGMVVGLADTLGFGIMKYQKPRTFVTNDKYGGYRIYNGETLYNSGIPQYDADIHYGNPEEPKLYYAEYDPAVITNLSLNLSFLEGMAVGTWKGLSKFDGKLKFDSEPVNDLLADTDLEITITHR